MGAGASKETSQKEINLSQTIDYIATNFITKQKFRDILNLSDMKYCNELVVLTADIIANTLNEMEIKFLAQRLKQGVEVNELTKERIIYLNRHNLDELDISNPTQKRRICIGIARFYVKIAHLFAAITTTINPVYTFIDSYGIKQEIPLLNKDSIPKNAKTTIQRINICSKRINALLNNHDYDVDKNSIVTINPSFCDINYNARTKQTRTLNDEPGIPELEKLYYDIYDYDKGGFVRMSEKTRKDIYEKDVETFYKAFSGKKNIPTDKTGAKVIKRFSDIPLRDFHKSNGCKSQGLYTQSYKGTLNDKLFSNYANHIKKMMQSATDNQNQLLSILEKLFVYSINPRTKVKEIVINPALTEKSLQTLIDDTRKIIINLYTTCEEDFITGLEMFEAIVENRIMNMTEAQVKHLESTMAKLIADSPTDIKGTISHTFQQQPTVTQPQRIVTQPQRIVTQPQQIVAQPQQIVAQPQRIVAQPQQIVAQPQRIVTQPQQIVAQPQQTFTQLPTQTGDTIRKI